MKKTGCHLKSCCGIFSIRVGSLIILILNLLCGCLLLSTSFIFSAPKKDIEEFTHSKPVEHYLNDHEYKHTTIAPPDGEPYVRKLSEELNLNYKAIETFLVWATPTGFAVTITSAVALIGVIKERPMFILPFIISSTFITFLLAVVEIAVSSTQFLTCTIAYLIVHSEIFVYFIMIVYTDYRIIAGYIDDDNV